MEARGLFKRAKPTSPRNSKFLVIAVAPSPPPIVAPVVVSRESSEMPGGVDVFLIVIIVILVVAGILSYRALPGKNVKQKIQSSIFYIFLFSLIYSVVMPLMGWITRFAGIVLSWFDISWKAERFEFLFDPYNLRNPMPDWAVNIPGAPWLWSMEEIWWCIIVGLPVSIALGFLTALFGYPVKDEIESSEVDAKVTQQSEGQSSTIINWNWLWPENRIASPGTVARFGRVIHWAGVAVSIILIGFGILLGFSGELGLGFAIAGLGFTIALFSRGALYVFSNE